MYTKKELTELNQQFLAMFYKEPQFSPAYNISGASYRGLNIMRLMIAQNQLIEDGVVEPEELSVWGTFKAWKNECSPISKGQKSAAKIVFNKKEQETDKYGNPVFEIGGYPIWKWNSFSYHLFHHSQTGGFRKAEFIKRRDKLQQKAKDEFQAKIDAGAVQKTDYLDWVNSDPTIDNLRSILHDWMEIKDISLVYFSDVFNPTLGGYWDEYDNEIGLLDSLLAPLPLMPWDVNNMTDLEVLVHECVHSVTPRHERTLGEYHTDKGYRAEEIIAILGTVMLYQMFGITKSAYASRVWQSLGDSWLNDLKELISEDSSTGLDIMKQTNDRVNELLRTVFEYRFKIAKAAEKEAAVTEIDEDVMA